MGTDTLLLSESVHAYLQSNSLREPEVLRRCRKETSSLEEARMQLSPEQGQFLSFLVELTGVKRAIEVGTFTGYSALCVATSMPADGILVACDISERWTSIAQQYWQDAKIDKMIDLRIGPAVETLDGLLSDGEAESYDFALIDADKGNYEVYYERILRLVRSGGLIAVDNVLWSGKVADLSNQDSTTLSIRSLNEKVLRDERVSLTMLPIGDGMTLVRKRDKI